MSTHFQPRAQWIAHSGKPAFLLARGGDQRKPMLEEVERFNNLEVSNEVDPHQSKLTTEQKILKALEKYKVGTEIDIDDLGDAIQSKAKLAIKK